MNNELTSEIRKDPIVGRWVIIGKDKGYMPPIEEHIQRSEGVNCPFCAGAEDKTPPEIFSVKDSSGKWRIRVIPNKFPALVTEGNPDRSGIGIFDRMNGIGAHEVIIETPEHKKAISDLSKEEYTDVLKTYQARIRDLKKDARFRYVLVFKNEGEKAGSSVEHSHSQLIATPIIPKRVYEEINGSKFYFEYKKRCIFCDIIQHDSKFFPERVVFQNDDFIILSPFAARFPFETWILPKEHASAFEDSSDALLLSLSEAVLFLLVSLNRILGNPPYNIILHNSPLKNDCAEFYHWHLEIIPKIKTIAGFEWGTGFYINPLSPEEAGTYLKKGGEG